MHAASPSSVKGRVPLCGTRPYNCKGWRSEDRRYKFNTFDAWTSPLVALQERRR